MNRAFLGEETADFHNPYGHAVTRVPRGRGREADVVIPLR